MPLCSRLEILLLQCFTLQIHQRYRMVIMGDKLQTIQFLVWVVVMTDKLVRQPGLHPLKNVFEMLKWFSDKCFIMSFRVNLNLINPSFKKAVFSIRSQWIFFQNRKHPIVTIDVIHKAPLFMQENIFLSGEFRGTDVICKAKLWIQVRVQEQW